MAKNFVWGVRVDSVAWWMLRWIKAYCYCYVRSLAAYVHGSLAAAHQQSYITKSLAWPGWRDWIFVLQPEMFQLMTHRNSVEWHTNSERTPFSSLVIRHVSDVGRLCHDRLVTIVLLLWWKNIDTLSKKEDVTIVRDRDERKNNRWRVAVPGTRCKLITWRAESLKNTIAELRTKLVCEKIQESL